MSRFAVEVTELDGEPFIVEPLTMVIHGDDTISRVITETHKYKDDTCTFRLIDTENMRLERQLKRKTTAKTCLSMMYENARDENRRLRGLYDDLIYQVATKHPNESRHETAKRYIMQAEQPSDNQVECAALQEGE